MIRGAVRPGDSGGGVLNAAGQLVGVVWGQRDGLTYATCGRPVREFLNRVRGQALRGNNQPLPIGDSPQSPSLQPRKSTGKRGRPKSKRASVRSMTRSKTKATTCKPGDLNGYLRVEDAAASSMQRSSQRSKSRAIEAIVAIRIDPFERVESFDSTSKQIAASRRSDSSKACRSAKLLVGALGLSGPLAAAVIVAGGLAGRRIEVESPEQSREPKIAQPRRSSASALDSQPIAVDSPAAAAAHGAGNALRARRKRLVRQSPSMGQRTRRPQVPGRDRSPPSSGLANQTIPRSTTRCSGFSVSGLVTEP